MLRLGLKVNPELHPSPWVVRKLDAPLSGQGPSNSRSDKQETRKSMSQPTTDGRLRVVITRLSPEIDGGRFAIKRVSGEKVVVEADVFADGHDQVCCQVLYWRDQNQPQVSPMKPLGNDRWRGEFSVAELGKYRYTVEGWIDRFQTWRKDLEKRIAAKQDVSVDLLIGAGLIEAAAGRAQSEHAKLLLD